MNYKFWSGIFAVSILAIVTLTFGIYLGQKSAYQKVTAQNVLGEKNQSPKKDCTTIQDGMLMYSPGHYLESSQLITKYDAFGYNYQAHQFRGSYANVYLGRDGFPPYSGDDEAYLANSPGAANTWYWPYRNDELVMKWSDSWLSNLDCDSDDLLDRHFGFDTYIGSGAWETNHQSGEYELNGETCKWNYFVKISAVPGSATLDAGIWYTENGAEIGPNIWGQFAITQEVYNDPCEGARGIDYLSPSGPGFGKWK